MVAKHRTKDLAALLCSSTESFFLQCRNSAAKSAVVGRRYKDEFFLPFLNALANISLLRVLKTHLTSSLSGTYCEAASRAMLIDNADRVADDILKNADERVHVLVPHFLQDVDVAH